MNVPNSMVEDVAQDVFISVFENLKNYDESKAQFSTWIFTIAKNKALNHLRKIKIKSFFGFQNEALECDKIVIPIDKILVEYEIGEKLVTYLNQLPQKYRTCCVLYFFNELKIEQIAVIEKCSVGTVKSRLFRGKEILKEQMKGYWV